MMKFEFLSVFDALIPKIPEDRPVFTRSQQVHKYSSTGSIWFTTHPGHHDRPMNQNMPNDTFIQEHEMMALQ